IVTLFQLPITLRLTTLFHTSYCLPHTLYCLPPVSVTYYIPLLPGPTSCIYRGLSAIQNKQSPHPFLSGLTVELCAELCIELRAELRVEPHVEPLYTELRVELRVEPHV